MFNLLLLGVQAAMGADESTETLVVSALVAAFNDWSQGTLSVSSLAVYLDQLSTASPQHAEAFGKWNKAMGSSALDAEARAAHYSFWKSCKTVFS